MKNIRLQNISLASEFALCEKKALSGIIYDVSQNSQNVYWKGLCQDYTNNAIPIAIKTSISESTRVIDSTI